MSAPQWLIDCMEANRKRVAAMTPEQLRDSWNAQMKASEEFRWKYISDRARKIKKENYVR